LFFSVWLKIVKQTFNDDPAKYVLIKVYIIYIMGQLFISTITLEKDLLFFFWEKKLKNLSEKKINNKRQLFVFFKKFFKKIL